MFAGNFSKDLVGKSPKLVVIDGGTPLHCALLFGLSLKLFFSEAVVQNTSQGFNYNSESNLDLQYGMTLVTANQPVTLYQVGDLVEGSSYPCY